MKKFTAWQLFSLVDGRLSTNMDDVYEMLNHITGTSLMTHQLPTALQFITQLQPLPVWFIRTKNIIDDAKGAVGNDYIKLEEWFITHNEEITVQPLTELELKWFGDYMGDNSLLKDLGKNAK